MPDQVYEAIVVGAGPGGISAVGCLLERNVFPIMWIDESFNGGKINEAYREVPSNTRVKLITQFATALSPFRQILQGSDGYCDSNSDRSMDQVAHPLLSLLALNPDGFCPLSYAADLLVALTNGLRNDVAVQSRVGRALAATFNVKQSYWNVNGVSSDGDSLMISGKRLVFCTGASPIRHVRPPAMNKVPYIHLDTALSPKSLSKELGDQKRKQIVAVVGASHSAVLVLRNLAELANDGQHDLEIRWLTRRELHYAEWMNGTYVRDNTGLKGDAATWARANLESVRTLHQNHINKIAYSAENETETFDRCLNGVTLLIQAVGYAPNPVPMIHDDVQLEDTDGLCFDHDTGCFRYVRLSPDSSSGVVAERVPHLFGAGIACSKRVKDVTFGHWEHNIGFRGFVASIQSWLDSWVSCESPATETDEMDLSPTDRRFTMHTMCEGLIV